MTVDDFTARYPEFTTCEPDVMTAMLGEAARAVSVDVYGNRTDDAVAALAAHKIFVSPAGLSLRTESDQTDTSDYLKAYQQMRREMTPGFLVLN